MQAPELFKEQLVVESGGQPPRGGRSESKRSLVDPQTRDPGNRRVGGKSASGAGQKRKKHSKPGHGAVAIVVEQEKFLIIRRSSQVRAPNLLCFAGGTIEAGETPHEAIEREILEELGLRGTAREHVWQSRTHWGTLLEWILVERNPESVPRANPLEVAEWMWLTGAELLARPDLLPSVPAFYAAWAKGEISLPSRAGNPDPAWRHF